MAICECSSIIPLVMCFPLASITVAPASERFLPTAAIFPFLIKTSVSVRIPSFSFVQTVAFLNNKVWAVCFLVSPKATFG
ncbi:hypothetical protein D3C87_1773810 [compost metagenome]